MSPKPIRHAAVRSTARKNRIDEIRNQFQSTRPSASDLLASGDVSEFVPLGGYFDLCEAMQAMKRERERKGLSLTTVAERSKMDKAAISRLENGLQANPTVATLNRYAAAIDAEIVWSVRTVASK